jgi:tetratricopeptide (TPR) repeat protein
MANDGVPSGYRHRLGTDRDRTDRRSDARRIGDVNRDHPECPRGQEEHVTGSHEVPSRETAERERSANCVGHDRRAGCREIDYPQVAPISQSICDGTCNRDVRDVRTVVTVDDGQCERHARNGPRSRAALAPLRTEAEERGDSRGWNRYGIAAAQFGAHGEAESAFERARALDTEYLSPVLNLGSLYFLRQDYDQALSVFAEAAESVETARRVRSSERFKVYINLSRTHHSLQNYADADRYFAQAREIDPEAVREFSYIATSGGDSGEIGRASEVGRAEPILFFEEE